MLPYRRLTANLEKLKVVQLVLVLHNILLDLAAHGPRDKVLHGPGDEHGRVRDHVHADAHVALLDELGGGRYVFSHMQPRHDDGQPPPCKGADGGAVLDGRQLGLC